MIVLLVWDSCGLDEIELYELVGSLAKLAVEANGQYVNSSDLPPNSAVDRLSEQLFYDEKGKKIESHRQARKLLPGERGGGPYSNIVVAGFLP